MSHSTFCYAEHLWNGSRFVTTQLKIKFIDEANSLLVCMAEDDERLHIRIPYCSAHEMKCALNDHFESAPSDERVLITMDMPLSRQELLCNMPYEDYLATAEWAVTRYWMLERVGGRCQVCNSPQQPLNVHHRTYERRGKEHWGDLTVLCQDCHHLFHEHGRLTVAAEAANDAACA